MPLTKSFIGLTNIIIGFAIVLVILFRPHGLLSLLDIFKVKKQREKIIDDEPEVYLSNLKQGGTARDANL